MGGFLNWRDKGKEAEDMRRGRKGGMVCMLLYLERIGRLKFSSIVFVCWNNIR
jgi:hypothetical protein